MFVYVYVWTCVTLRKNNLLFKLYARWITYHSCNVLSSLGNNVWLSYKNVRMEEFLCLKELYQFNIKLTLILDLCPPRIT